MPSAGGFQHAVPNNVTRYGMHFCREGRLQLPQRRMPAGRARMRGVRQDCRRGAGVGLQRLSRPEPEVAGGRLQHRLPCQGRGSQRSCQGQSAESFQKGCREQKEIKFQLPLPQRSPVPGVAPRMGLFCRHMVEATPETGRAVLTQKELAPAGGDLTQGRKERLKTHLSKHHMQTF